MPESVPQTALNEKNKITSSDAFLLLVEYRYGAEPPIYLCLNNADITWNGIAWEAACFSVDKDTESKEGDLPSLPLSFIDPNRRITPILDQYGGGNGADVWIRTVHSAHLDETEAWRTRYFKSMGAKVNHLNQVTIRLGVPNLALVRDPIDRFFKNHGRNTVKFKDSTCGYTGGETDCDKTLKRCRELGNSIRYCGFPGVGRKGFLV